jgi:hypothetical protein
MLNDVNTDANRDDKKMNLPKGMIHSKNSVDSPDSGRILCHGRINAIRIKEKINLRKAMIHEQN